MSEGANRRIPGKPGLIQLLKEFRWACKQRDLYPQGLTADALHAEGRQAEPIH